MTGLSWLTIGDTSVPKTPKDFFADCDELYGFFRDCDAMIAQDKRTAKRRRINQAKARRIYPRLLRVRAYDPWDATEWIEPDVFGDNYQRLKSVMMLTNKRNRIEWVLWAMYHYWMFDAVVDGAKNYGNRYSMFRRLWFKHLKALKEQVRQKKWDKKRERVRNRRRGIKPDKRRDATETLAILKAKRTMDVIDNIEDTYEIEGLYEAKTNHSNLGRRTLFD
jgi:hypothetical protein